MRMACIQKASTASPLVTLLTETVSAFPKALKKRGTNAILIAPGSSPQVNSLATTSYSWSTRSLQNVKHLSVVSCSFTVNSENRYRKRSLTFNHKLTTESVKPQWLLGVRAIRHQHFLNNCAILESSPWSYMLQLHIIINGSYTFISATATGDRSW